MPCPFGAGFAEQIAPLAAQLGAALAELKAVAAGGGLEAKCVAPQRSIGLWRPEPLRPESL